MKIKCSAIIPLNGKATAKNIMDAIIENNIPLDAVFTGEPELVNIYADNPRYRVKFVWDEER